VKHGKENRLCGRGAEHGALKTWSSGATHRRSKLW